MKKLFWMRVINDPESKEKTIWKAIKESKIDQKEIEERFADKRSANTFDESKGLGANIVKIVGPQKKTYFTPEESRSIQMSIPKLPKPEVLKDALVNFEENACTADSIIALLRVWPKDSPVDQLESESKSMAKNEVWDKSEAYFLPLAYP